jgi:hypothetical protein
MIEKVVEIGGRIFAGVDNSEKHTDCELCDFDNLRCDRECLKFGAWHYLREVKKGKS